MTSRGAARGRGAKPPGPLRAFAARRAGKSSNRKGSLGSEVVVLLLILVFLLAVILFGLGFAVKVLFWIALAVIILWLLGFLVGGLGGRGGGRRRRWYYW